MRPFAIVLFADALSAIEVCWSLHNADFAVLAIRKRGTPCPLRTSRFVRTVAVADPNLDLQKSTTEIQEILDGLDVDRPLQDKVLIPLDDTALLVCSSLNIPSSINQASPNAETARVALDKWKQFEIATQCGFNSIETTLINPKTIVSNVSTPCILKPRFAVERDGSQIAKRKFYSCPDQEVLKEVLSETASEEAYISQPFLNGIGEGIFGFATLKETKILSAHQRIRMMNPEGSGSSACKSIEVSAELEKSALEFVRRAKWTGLFMIELIRDSDGKVWFMEFNGRPWGSTALGRRMGLEYPAWHALAALGKELPKIERTKFSPTICRHIGREIIHFLFVIRGPKNASNITWPKAGLSLITLLTPRSNQYWYNFRWSDPLPFFADTLWTIASIVMKRKS